MPTIYFCTRTLVNITHLPCVAWTTKFSNSCPLLDNNICFVSHLRVDNFDKYTLYVVLLGEPCRKHHIFCMFLHIWIFGSFENIVTRTFENIIWSQLQVHEKITMKKYMFLSLDILLMKWYNYVYWAHRHFILSCVSAKKCRASASEHEWWCRSADEHQWTCVHRVWAQHSATERLATATKRVASVLMPQLNRHLISLDRTAVAHERNWACLGVRQPWYHESESRTAKFYGVRLRFSSWRCHDGFLTKTANV